MAPKRRPILLGALIIASATAVPAQALTPAPVPASVDLPPAVVQTAAGTSALPIQAFCASAVSPCVSVTYTLTPPSIPDVAVAPGEIVHFVLGVDPTSVLLDIPQPAGGPDQQIPLTAARTTDWSAQPLGSAELVATSSVGTIAYGVRFVAPTPPLASPAECAAWGMRAGRLAGRIAAIRSHGARARTLRGRLTKERAGFVRLLEKGCTPAGAPSPTPAELAQELAAATAEAQRAAANTGPCPAEAFYARVVRQGRPFYWFVLRGGPFVDGTAPRPAGAPAPSGSVLAIVADVRAGGAAVVSVGGQFPPPGLPSGSSLTPLTWTC